MSNYDQIDLDFSWNGDFIKGKDGDIGDTSDDQIRSLENEIHNVVKSEFSDWEFNPQIGANLSEYRGEPNTREVGISLQDRVRTRIVSVGLVRPEDINVRVVPITIHEVLILIRIQTTATPNNRLETGEPIVVNLVYDSLENSVFFFKESETIINHRTA